MSTEDEAAAQASVDVWGEAIMKMIRERLRIRVSATGSRLQVALLDQGTHGAPERLISMDTLDLVQQQSVPIWRK